MELLSLFLFVCFAWALYIWACVICWQKGRKVYFWLGLLLGVPTNVIEALRLGKPGSGYAERNYDSTKMARARARFG